MLIPKPLFEFYRDCFAFGNSYNIWNCFGLGLYTTHIRYSRWRHNGSGHCFRNLQTHCFNFNGFRGNRG